MSDGDCVRVAVNIRPLIDTEVSNGCVDCISVTPGEPQVQIGSHSFTYDHVYGTTSSSPLSDLYPQCVAPLVDALFQGYNATVFAYGQTGSGKTYTMGTSTSTSTSSQGVIPKVMDAIFDKLQHFSNTQFLFKIRVSFIEIFKEDVFDLLGLEDPTTTSHHQSRSARVPIQIRETVNGGICLAGVTEPEVRSKEEMASYLTSGSLSRATASTHMNTQSSRSHAIFTITLEQKRIAHPSKEHKEDFTDDILCAKFHLVDLAGSERAKRTGADGSRLKEGIHINRGLLALGNVISALGDEKKRKEGGHVPYRDSKLTRLLQDSLGGNSKTIMIACVSPADSNAEETINTLKYANRARNIQNKAVINHDPVTAEMQKLRSKVEQLQSELLYFRSGGSPFEELQVLQERISVLEAHNAELRQSALDAQVERDQLILTLESIRRGEKLGEDGSVDKGSGILKGYISKIQDLEAQLLRLQKFHTHGPTDFVSHLGLHVDGTQPKDTFLQILNHNASADIEEDEKEIEHSSLQDKLGKELQILDKQLEEKEEEMRAVSKTNTSVLKLHYEKKLLELEHEKRTLQKEIDDLRFNLENIASTTDDGAKKLKEQYLQRLGVLESQVLDLKKKHEAQSQLLRQKEKSDEAAKRLQEEIHRIKSQKVQLQHKMKQDSEQFRSWKASREKEVLQLKKEGRRIEYEMHKLQALNQRQKMVLQRKTEEASLAVKRLKEVLDAKKNSRDMHGFGSASNRGLEALIHTIDNELEVTTRVHEVRSEYQRQLEAKAAMAGELSKLKDELEMFRQKKLSGCSSTMSPSVRSSRICALENMLSATSRNIVNMASQLSEADDQRLFKDRGRWNQVRSLPDAKNLLNHMFGLVSSSRCRLQDCEKVCSDKDLVIKELKEKIVSLGCFVRELEQHNVQMVRQSKKGSRRNQSSAGISNQDLLLEDMDTSDSDYVDDNDSDEDYVASRKKMPKRKRSRSQAPLTGFCLEDTTGSKTFLSENNVKNGAVCCSCSKSSTCKTKKCECRSANGLCGESCGCMSSKCANREFETTIEVTGESDGQTTNKNKMLAARGAMLLESALADRSSAVNDNTRLRKPLSDIGNKVSVSEAAPKPSRKKNWRKPAPIELVSTTPSLPPRPGTSVDEAQQTNIEIPVKLPRAMGSTLSKRNSVLGETNDTNGWQTAETAQEPQDSDGKEEDT